MVSLVTNFYGNKNFKLIIKITQFRSNLSRFTHQYVEIILNIQFKLFQLMLERKVFIPIKLINPLNLSEGIVNSQNFSDDDLIISNSIISTKKGKF